MDPALDGPAVAAAYPGRRGYLDTATYGLPSIATIAALQRHLEEWRDGSGTLVSWNLAIHQTRELFAGIVGVPADWVSVGSQVSVAVGTVAASLPPGSTVVLAEGDFTSLTWPFLARPDLSCRTVPLPELCDAAAAADWVAVSAVQSSDGAVVELSALARSGAHVLLDATQAVGWLPIDAGDFDIVTVGAYKWLSCPRGTAFTTVRPEALTALTPNCLGWYAGDDPLLRLYSAEVAMAPDARRLDVSPAWMCWAGAVPALRQIADRGVQSIHSHDVALANRLRLGLGLAPAESPIVAVDVAPDVADRIVAAGIRASGRAGRLRFAPHFYNDEDDVDRVLELVRLPSPVR